MLTKRRRRRQWKQKKQNKTKQKQKIGLISKKKKLFTCSTLFCKFLCRCFAQRQRETPKNFPVTRFMAEMLYVVLFTFFLLPLIFTLVAASISHFLTATIKFSCYSSTKLVFFAFFISGSSSFTVIHANEDLKIKSKERIGFVVVVFNL